MQQTRNSFWDIPEHVIYLAQFLDKDQLAAASAVCKNWNTIFTPYLYSDITWHPNRDEKVPTAWILRAHAHQVRSFRVRRSFPDVSFTLLRTLIVDTSNSDQEFWNQFASLTIQNSYLQSVKVNMESCPDKDRLQIMEALSQCKHLQELTLLLFYFDNAVAQYILQLSTRLQSLSIHSIYASPINLSDQPLPPLDIKDLTLSISLTMPLSEQFDIIRRCPQLNRLCWILKEHPTVNQDIHEIFSDCRLPVKELILNNRFEFDRERLSDESLDRIVESCPNIISFSTDRVNFGPLTFHSLKRRFGSLTILKVIYSPIMTSSMVQEIMTSCPHLLDLTAAPLDARDILGIVEGTNVAGDEGEGKPMLFQPQEWVCSKLTSFEVPICGFTGKPVEWQRQVLRQLSRLERLKYLGVGSYDLYSTDYLIDDGLDLRLESGLDILGSLKQLIYFQFLGLGRYMDEQDLRWMMQNWPLLRDMDGFADDDERLVLFQGILAEGGIKLI